MFKKNFKNVYKKLELETKQIDKWKNWKIFKKTETYKTEKNEETEKRAIPVRSNVQFVSTGPRNSTHIGFTPP